MTNAKSRGPRPDYYFRRVIDIELGWLSELGIHGVILDIDNALTRWEEAEVRAPELAWLKSLKDVGLRCRLLSNGLSHKRAKVEKQTGIPQVGGLVVKPLTAAFSRSLSELELPAEQVLMIGDIIVTDIWPANRVGIWTALVDPLSPVDFPGTRVWRFLERNMDWRKTLLPERDMRGKG
ncbi:YqeG family HAD IIIA-type phosphatase [bacterium]|nr:YqeG family HAD IIIA-type phosphatase [bacterium]